MTDNEVAVLRMMHSVQERYFPELEDQITFSVRKDPSADGVRGRAMFGSMEVVLHYSDDRILEPRYRMGLVPVVAHELAHFVDPVDPERILGERLPSEMVGLWKALISAGHASCSMEAK